MLKMITCILKFDINSFIIYQWSKLLKHFYSILLCFLNKYIFNENNNKIVLDGESPPQKKKKEDR